MEFNVKDDILLALRTHRWHEVWILVRETIYHLTSKFNWWSLHSMCRCILLMLIVFVNYTDDLSITIRVDCWHAVRLEYWNVRTSGRWQGYVWAWVGYSPSKISKNLQKYLCAPFTKVSLFCTFIYNYITPLFINLPFIWIN